MKMNFDKITELNKKKPNLGQGKKSEMDHEIIEIELHDLEMAMEMYEPSKDETLKCEICLKWFRSEKYLSKHRALDHFGEQSFRCESCGIDFGELGTFESHIQICPGEVSFKCIWCDEEFKSREDLNLHKSTHNVVQEGRFECNECGKRFTTKTHLTTHTRIHTGETPYGCPQCPRRFIRCADYHRHLAIHSGKKPFKCTCGKAFSEITFLKRHARIHTGLRPYSCELCDKSFVDRSHLKRHGLVHTGDKRFACGDCGSTFIQRTDLLIHQRVHTGETPYQCPDCKKCFKKSWNLTRHVRLVHATGKQKRSVERKNKIPRKTLTESTSDDAADDDASAVLCQTEH